MHRNDKSKFLLYIEPKKEEKLIEPINDELTKLMGLAFSQAKRGAANYSDIDEPENFKDDGWRGWHDTDCGETSDNHDYLLQNGLIVNSLCVFYVKWYRNSIHENDWNKLKQLGNYYDVDIQLPDKFPNSLPSTKPKTYEKNMNNLETLVVDELAKTIDRNIVIDLIKQSEYSWILKNKK